MCQQSSYPKNLTESYKTLHCARSILILNSEWFLQLLWSKTLSVCATLSFADGSGNVAIFAEFKEINGVVTQLGYRQS